MLNIPNYCRSGNYDELKHPSEIRCKSMDDVQKGDYLVKRFFAKGIGHSVYYYKIVNKSNKNTITILYPDISTSFTYRYTQLTPKETGTGFVFTNEQWLVYFLYVLPEKYVDIRSHQQDIGFIESPYSMQSYEG
jgi:hypothetical protein